MTHKTGPRPKIVENLHNKFFSTWYHRGKATISEAFAAAAGLEEELLISLGIEHEAERKMRPVLRELRGMHRVKMRWLKRVLRSYEKDCPTCPK